ncbi:MAG: mycothiol synthase [Acidimicrobiales bacterium]|jgi:mycothiol synthase
MDEPTIAIGEDRDGPVVEVDASQWEDGADLAMALRPLLGELSRPVSVWVDHPNEATDAYVARIGLSFQRDLYRMERPLPMDQTTDIETRSFVIGQDEAAWVAVNNKAFAWHREQSGWTTEMVRERQAEDWFDPDGFRIHEIDGQLAAYCWTKVHADVDPPVGEVYVIAVDPDFHGRGLGRALTLAGYQHLASNGITHGLLYVDADNVKAVGLYRDIGLEVAVVRRLYTA